MFSTHIEKLRDLLTANHIPHDFHPLYDGYQIVMHLPNTDVRLDAICHSGSYGCEKDLLEIMGGLTEEEEEEDEVLGYLTAEEVYKRFAYCYNNHTLFYKEN